VSSGESSDEIRELDENGEEVSLLSFLKIPLRMIHLHLNDSQSLF
jgi:hypothetical protein